MVLWSYTSTADEEAFGHDKVSVLDGGLPRWIEEGFETEMGELPDNGGSEYVAAKDKDPELVRSE